MLRSVWHVVTGAVTTPVVVCDAAVGTHAPRTCSRVIHAAMHKLTRVGAFRSAFGDELPLFRAGVHRSLSALGDVLEALEKKSQHIPYRNSKLTHLLQDSLSANSRTLMICAVSPTSQTADETHFTLQVWVSLIFLSQGTVAVARSLLWRHVATHGVLSVRVLRVNNCGYSSARTPYP